MVPSLWRKGQKALWEFRINLFYIVNSSTPKTIEILSRKTKLKQKQTAKNLGRKLSKYEGKGIQVIILTERKESYKYQKENLKLLKIKYTSNL